MTERQIGICDIVGNCKREKIDTSDLGMQQVQLCNLIGYLKKHTTVDTLLYTGGNSKNEPEYFFRKHLKEYGIKLQIVSNEIPRIHNFHLDSRTIKTVSLTAPSGSTDSAVKWPVL